MRRSFRSFGADEVRLLLLEHGDRLLASFPASLSGKAAASLRRLGVDPITGAKVTVVDRDGVWAGVGAGAPMRIRSRMLVWAAGAH